MAERKGRRKGGKKYSPPTSEASFKVTANCIQVTDGDVSSLNIVTGTLNEKMHGGREESDTGFEGEITSTEKHTTLDYSKVRGIQRPTSGISGYDVTLKRIVTVAQIAPSQIVAVSKTFKFNRDGKKTLTTDILNEMNSKGTTEMQLKQQMIFYKDQLDNKREPKTTDAKQNEPSAKSVNPPEELESPPNESGNSPAEPDPPPTDSPKEPGLTSTDSGTDCVNKLGDSDTKDNLRKSSGNADNVPAETESSNEPTISHDPPSTQGSSAGAGCPNEQGNSSDPSSTQDTSTTGTPSYQSTPSSKTDKHSDVTSDQTENSQTLRTSHDLPSKDSTAKTKDSHFNQNHKKRMKTQQETPSQAPRKRSCRSRNKRDAIKNRNLKKNEGKNHFPKQPPSHDVTRTSYDTDKQLVHQQTLDLASRKKKPLQRRRRGIATKGEESWPNSDDSESKRDATDCYESTRSRVKSKRPNSIKRHRTRAPQSGDGGGAPRDPEQSIQSCDSDSVSEDKSWTRPTQETDPATSTEMVYPRPRPLPLTNEGQLNLYVSSHEPPRLEEMMASSVQVFAEPLHDSSTTSQLVSPPSCVPVSLQPPSLYWFRINVIRGRSCGITLRDAISGYVQRKDPNQLRRLIAALIQFVMMWGTGIRSLDAVTVQGEGVVNVVESGLVQVASSDWESQLEVLLLLANIVEEFLCLWGIQAIVGHYSSDISPLRLLVVWVRNFRNRRVRIVTSPLVDALHQLGERSLRQRSPFVVEDASEDDDP